MASGLSRVLICPVNRRSRFAVLLLLAALGWPARRAVSSDPDQLQATLGFVWSVRPTLDLSLTGLVGSLSGGDRYGLLFGISPKVRLFK
jgi:hypothetical protein